MAKSKKRSPKVHRLAPGRDAHAQPAATPGAETPYISPLARPALPWVSWYEILATGFFSGYLPKAPGTWGSLAAVLIFFFTAKLVPHAGIFHAGFIPVSWWALLLGIAATLLGILSSGILATEWHEKDPGEIVIDEFAGMFFACALVHPALPSLAAAFIFFRLFDIFKPGIVGTLQTLPGGRGIVLDDVAAGLFAAPLALGVEFLMARFFTV